VTKSRVRPAQLTREGDGLDDADRGGTTARHARRLRCAPTLLAPTPITLAVQWMVLDGLRAQRPERVETDIERHPLYIELANSAGVK